MFGEVVEAGSFAQASRRLRQPSSNVSRRIAKLEHALGYPLLQRTTRSLIVTEEGKQLLPMARQLMDLQEQVEQWQNNQQSEPTGILRVTAPSSFARGPLSTWMIQYKRCYPSVTIELIHSNDYLDFQTHQLDFAFRQGPLPNSTLIAKRLFSIQYGVFASPKWLATQPPLLVPSDLIHAPVIAMGAQGKPLPWRFRDQVIQPQRVQMLLEEPEQNLQAAITGLGYTFASRYDASPWEKQGALQEVLLNHRAEPAHFYLVSNSHRDRSLKAKTFLTHIEKSLMEFGEPDGLVF
nr:LysR family transcriptional regulator [Marinibactrum halimedae]